jgi:Tfp pilus assembly protein FimT
MIVMAIAGVLAAMAAPSMRDMLQNQKVKTAASDAHISFLMARSEAIKRGVNVEVEYNDSAWNKGWDVQVPSDGTILKTQDPMPELTVDDIPASTSKIAFTRTGRSNAPLELRFYISGNPLVTMRCVSISLSGRPHVELDTDGDSSDGVCD